MIISFDKVSYQYNQEVVLKEISFSVDKQEKLAIVGANGSGKSTLLKLLDGLFYSTSGQFNAFGKNINENFFQEETNEIWFRKQMGYVFQDADTQLFSPTVWDEVAYGPLHLGLHKDEIFSRVESTIEYFSLQKLVKRSPYLLSGGEKKKVALASVFSIRPTVYLLDEPTAGLDPRSQSLLIDNINKINSDQGATIITATHDIEILDELANRVIVLSEDHEVVFDGEVSRLLKDESMLIKYNLMHDHLHRHIDQKHRHPHKHYHEH